MPEEIASSIQTQYGYRKLGTHARVFSQTLAYGNRKIEIRQLKIEGRRQEVINMERSTVGTNSPINLNFKSHLTSSSHNGHSRQSVAKFVVCSLVFDRCTTTQKSIGARREDVTFSTANVYGYRKWGTHARLRSTCVFPNTRAWEHQDGNKTKKQRKKVRRGE